MTTPQRVIIEKPASNGLAVTALVLGIVALVLSWIPFLPYPLAILAIVFGVIGRNKPTGRGAD